MARGPDPKQARNLTYRIAKQVIGEVRRKYWPAKGRVELIRTSEPKAWCPSYRIEGYYDSGRSAVHINKVVRLIRASNGEAAVITEDV